MDLDPRAVPQIDGVGQFVNPRCSDFVDADREAHAHPSEASAAGDVGETGEGRGRREVIRELRPGGRATGRPDLAVERPSGRRAGHLSGAPRDVAAGAGADLERYGALARGP